jgi:CubicO group peptidase (beta-lactamase class C family)
MREAPGIGAARRRRSAARADGRFPAAAVEVGGSDTLQWQEAFGTLTFDPGAPPATIDTVFDLASLTKPLVTTTLILNLVARGELHLTDLVRDGFAEWRGVDRESVAVTDLLEHSSGLPARLPDGHPHGRRAFEHAICTLALESVPRSQSQYSDLGFLLLGFLAADRSNETLDRAFARCSARIATAGTGAALESLTFGVAADARSNVAPTEPLPGDVRQGRRLTGEVHDVYAAALDGVAGHAGLFGTAAGVGVLAKAVLVAARGVERQPALLPASLVQRALLRSAVPGSSRALGWDTMLVTSSCGTRMSHAAFGHVGFTGTSLWIDPLRDRYFVLLTNRVCGGCSIDDMRSIRREFHDALGDA